MSTLIHYFKWTLFGIWLFTSAFITCLVGVFRPKDPDLNHFFYQLFSPFVFWLFQIDLEIRGREHVSTSRSVIYVCNHQSALDLAVLGILCPPRAVTVAKKELLWVPFYGAYLWISGNILIDRKNSKDSVLRLKQVISEIQKNKLSVNFFPEGTRTITLGDFKPFKKGAFHVAIAAKIPIVPLAVSSYKRVIDPVNGLLKAGKIIVQVLPPVSTDALTDKDLPKLVADVREKMKGAFDEIEKELA